MRKWIGSMALVAAMGLSADAGAVVVEGMLELQWGDPSPATSKLARRPSPRFQAFLVADDGQRFPLDTDEALQAAANLHALANRRIAVDFSAAGKGVSLYRVEAIVPADDLHSAGAPAAMIEGTTVWATIMCRFADIPDEQKPLSFFQSQYGNAQGQLDHYWREVSYGRIDLTGSSAHGWFVLPYPRSHYVTGGGQGAANLDALFDDCTAAADGSVNFAANGGLQGINMMFNGDLDGFAWGGGRCATLDGIYKCWSTTWNPPWSFNNLAPLAHEMGHGYGLPHANNSDNDNDPYDNPWDVMSSAWNNANSDPTYGAVAKHINIHHRDRMGWVAPARKLEVIAGEQHTAIQLDAASLAGSTRPQMIRVRVPGESQSRYYTVEARLRLGYYEPDLAGDAVIIHAVNENRNEPAWSVDAAVPPATMSNNEGSMFKPGETWTAPGNAFRVKVWAQNAAGFVVSICGPRPAGGPGDRRFDRCNVGPVDYVPRPR